MQLSTSTVEGEKVVVEFDVPADLEAELLESIAEADRGETISADELIERLRR